MTSTGSEPGRRRLRAVFFDIDDTFFSTSSFAERARENSVDAMIAMGLSADRETVLRELREVISEFSSNYEHHFDQLLHRLPAETRRGVNPALLVAAGIVAYHETKFRELTAYPDVLDVLRILSGSGLLLGVITAGLTVKQAEKLIRLRVYPYFHPEAIFISDQIGISKPNPKLYLRACESMGIAPREAMYVGDHPRHDIDPAHAVGMWTVWNRREGRHLSEDGASRPDFVIYNFWDLLALLRSDFDVTLPGAGIAEAAGS